MNDGADVLAIKCGGNAIGVSAVNDLKRIKQSRVVEQVQENSVEWQGLKFALPQFSHVNLADEIGVSVGLRVAVIEAIDVLYQSEILAPKAFGEQE